MKDTKDGQKQELQLPVDLRDWFAGMALAGFCANPEVHGTAKDLALPAYVQADAMIKEREK